MPRKTDAPKSPKSPAKAPATPARPFARVRITSAAAAPAEPPAPASAPAKPAGKPKQKPRPKGTARRGGHKRAAPPAPRALLPDDPLEQVRVAGIHVATAGEAVALYQRAWGAYVREPSAKAIAEAGLGLTPQQAHLLVKYGLPSLALPPLADKWRASVALAQQLDVETSARALVTARLAVDAGMLKWLAAIMGVNPAALDPDKLPQGFEVFWRMHERILAIEKGDAAAGDGGEVPAPLGSAAALSEAFSGIIRKLAAARLPGGSVLLESNAPATPAEGGPDAS